MTFNKETIDVLNQPLTVHQRPSAGGKSYPYVKGEDVIKQLNKAFGHAWSSKVLTQTEVHDQVLVSIELSVMHEGHQIFHHGYGSAPVARMKDGGKVIDIGNCYKSAFTTALKKAAEAFGIGLGGEDEAAAPAAKPATPYVRPAFVRPTAQPAKPAAEKPIAQPAVPVQDNKPTTSVSNLMPSEGRKITAVQQKALSNLSKLKSIPETELVSKALTGSGKSKFEELTEAEAVNVIRYANTTPKGR